MTDDHTHTPELLICVESAEGEGAAFPIQSLPFGRRRSNA